MNKSWKRNSSPSTSFICTAFEHSTKAFSNRKNCNYILQNEIVPLTMCSHKSNWEKVLLPSNFPIFIQKPAKTFELAPNHFNLIVLSFGECSWFKHYISDKHFYENGTSLVTDELPKLEPLLLMITLYNSLLFLRSCRS